MYNTRKELLLLGDFNMDMYHQSEEGRFPNRNLVDICQRFCLVNKISEPTRVTDKTKTLIDVVLTSHQERYATAGMLHLGVSDHDLVFIVRKNKLARPKPRLIEYRSMKNFDHANFLSDLKNAPWQSAYSYDNADDVWGHWSTLYKDILDQDVPIKRKWVRGDQLPWITPQILREISLRNRLFKRHKKNPSPFTWKLTKSSAIKLHHSSVMASRRSVTMHQIPPSTPGNSGRKCNHFFQTPVTINKII